LVIEKQEIESKEDVEEVEAAADDDMKTIKSIDASSLSIILDGTPGKRTSNIASSIQ
jgi:hypothetical protein